MAYTSVGHFVKKSATLICIIVHQRKLNELKMVFQILNLFNLFTRETFCKTPL